ncbi:hypothetical protein FuraDRAFT_2117 [Pseudogulbenkiania ferrooxidans 2002]|uniref:Uncharacterized protein n=1 Tax=Pseudogulbenkiania ferrooxidans 2002 TaxID=279714 RepID=B9Z432_9NEIS|nr:hypothetical protein FuraDRAFT_2117 [Pseudogulbenkiania ferrooxidans 2002]
MVSGFTVLNRKAAHYPCRYRTDSLSYLASFHLDLGDSKGLDHCHLPRHLAHLCLRWNRHHYL